jgi:hypothetical protein
MKERDNAMVRNNHCELDKFTIISWFTRVWTKHCLRKNQEWVQNYKNLAFQSYGYGWED